MYARCLERLPFPIVSSCESRGFASVLAGSPVLVALLRIRSIAFP
jgi:hypothetical protein